MTSVNSHVRVQLQQAAATFNADGDVPAAEDTRPAEVVGTPASGFSGGLTSMGLSVANTAKDLATYTGIAQVDDEGQVEAKPDPIIAPTFIGVTAGPAALMSLGGRTDALTGTTTGFGATFKNTAATGAIRVTPTLVSAVLGPAIADGVTMIAPNLVKKYKDTRELKTADEKKQAEKDNQYSKISRAVAGGLVVGVAAGAVFLLKPEIFKRFGAGVTHAIEGSTTYNVGGIIDEAGKLTGGTVHKLNGVLDASKIRTMAKVADGTSINVLNTVTPMAKDAVFSNRALTAAAGSIGTMLLANKAAGEDDPSRQKLMWGLTAAAGLATVGGAYGIGKLTQSGIGANGEAVGLLAKNTLLMKPNVEWLKKYASTIAPITAIPAGTAASQYFNIVNDFDEITATRSPFRK